MWHGSFYDMAVNRASIQRGELDLDALDSDFGNDLIINSSNNSQIMGENSAN